MDNYCNLQVIGLNPKPLNLSSDENQAYYNQDF